MCAWLSAEENDKPVGGACGGECVEGQDQTGQGEADWRCGLSAINYS